MARSHKPQSGSRGFWPRKRAKRIYNIFRSYPETKEAVPLGFAAYKAGMAQAEIIDRTKGSVREGKEVVIPVTVLDCPSLMVAGIKAYKESENGSLCSSFVIWKDGLSKDLARKTRIPKNTDQKKGLKMLEEEQGIKDIRLLVHTKPRDAGIGKKKPELFEVFLGGELKEKIEYAKNKLGKEIRVSDVFGEGDWVDVKAVTKGKGFQGPVKRFGVKVRGRKSKKKMRHIGTLGPRSWGRVKPNLSPAAGQLGFQTRTELNKMVIKLLSGTTPKGGWKNYGVVKGDCLILEGSVPGPAKRLVMIRKSIRPPKKALHRDFKNICF